MSRNANTRFAVNPANIDISRSRFNRNSDVKFTANVGELIPFYVDEVLPGDTFDVSTSKVVRLQTPITPFMDNLYLDSYFFFVPNRLVWEHWKQFQGENTESAWIPEVDYLVPQVQPPQYGWEVGSIADYMGVPIQVPGNSGDPETDPWNYSINALPFRCYNLIVNEWFRDQNLQDPCDLITGDALTEQSLATGTYITDLSLGLKPFVCAKYHDYFTTCLPSPQKGPDVTLPIGASAPVYTESSTVPDKTLRPGLSFQAIGFDTNVNKSLYLSGNGENAALLAADMNSTITGQNRLLVTPDNLFADLSLATGSSINQLRLAFQIQKLFEKDARGGTRYTEILKSHFGVTSPDSRLQRPEYLGGNRLPLSCSQVLNQSGAGQSYVGNTGAVSLTTDHHSDFLRSFTEHGFVIGVCVLRYDHSYQQGLERFWTRRTRFDYYMPVLANIGEQAVMRREIFLNGALADDFDTSVFGYQEAWADYRYKPSRVAGEMRSNDPDSVEPFQSLDSWHFSDYYEDTPYLSDEWIREDKSNVDRVLSVSSEVANQYFCDFFIQNKTTRAMPLYSIPGLIDHH